MDDKTRAYKIFKANKDVRDAGKVPSLVSKAAFIVAGVTTVIGIYGVVFILLMLPHLLN